MLEPACEAGFHAYENYEVNHNDGRNAGRLAIAILNSNAHSHVHKRGHFAKYSPCRFVETRYRLFKYSNKVKSVYNDHPRDPKFVAVVERWSLYRGSLILRMC